MMEKKAMKSKISGALSPIGNYRYIFSGGKSWAYGYKSFYDHRIVWIDGSMWNQVEVYAFGDLTWINAFPDEIEFFKKAG